MADWQERAACIGTPTNVFFPEIEKGEWRDHVWEPARAICARCPVRAECLAYALPFEETTGRRDGMFGGMTPKERDAYWWASIQQPRK